MSLVTEHLSEKVRVLVFPCGAENGTEIHNALRYSLHVQLFGASSVDDHGRFRYANYNGNLPNIADPQFLAAFATLLKKWQIDVIFPTHDTVCEFLAAHSATFDCFVVNSDPVATRTARKKSLTYKLFSDQPWVPRVYRDLDAVTTWPVVIKPDMGQGGRGIRVVDNILQAKTAMVAVTAPLLTEYLPGAEVTVDCFTDRHGRVLFVGPRTRERVRAGIAMRSRFLANDAGITDIAERINCRMKLRGPWFFQLKRDTDDHWKLLEVSCRVAGSMVAQRARGVNLPLLTIHDYLGRDVAVNPSDSITMIDRSLSTYAEFNVEFDDVFVDLDDTLVIGGRATHYVVAFLYLMVARDKRIVLITRHANDVTKTLEDARLSPGLFDEIIHIQDGSDKADYVTARAVFIDNHYPERLSVSRRCNVPVFDVDALEFHLR